VQENAALKNRLRALEADSRARIAAVELDCKRFQDEVRLCMRCGVAVGMGWGWEVTDSPVRH